MRTMDNDVVVNSNNNNNNGSMNFKSIHNKLVDVRVQSEKKCTFAGVWLLIWVDVIRTITFYWLQNIRQLDMYSWCVCVRALSFFYENFFALWILFFFFFAVVAACCFCWIFDLVEQPCCVCVYLQHIRLSFWLNTFNF